MHYSSIIFCLSIANVEGRLLSLHVSSTRALYRKTGLVRRFVGQTIFSFPFDRNYFPVGCDAAFAKANIASTTVKSFRTSNSPLFPFCLFIGKKTMDAPQQCGNNTFTDELTTRIPSRYYGIIFPEMPRNAFPRYFYYVYYFCTQLRAAHVRILRALLRRNPYSVIFGYVS